MNPDLQDPIGLPVLYEDNETFYTGREIERTHGVINAQIPLALSGQGLGVRKGVGGEMLVTAAAGLSVNITSGVAVVGAGTDEALGCGIQLANAIVRGGLEANRGSGNPLYLFAAFYEGDGTTVFDSFETRQGYFPVANTPTVVGWVLLATITTGANSILSVTPNPNRFIQLAGDASTTTKGIAKLSVAPVSPTNPIAVGDNDPRNTNARTPTAHAVTHKSGGADAIRLDELANPTGDVSLNGQKITNVGAPTLSTDAARQMDVDAARAGLRIKDAVRAATTANITLSSTQTIDGVALVAGDRVLVKDQTTGSQNGIYVVAGGGMDTLDGRRHERGSQRRDDDVGKRGHGQRRQAVHSHHQ